MKIAFSIFLLICISGHLNAQALYQRAYYGMWLFYGKGCVTSDGGFTVMGNGYNSSNDEDNFLMRLDAMGDTLWTRMYLYPGGTESMGEVLQTIDGGFFMTSSHYVLKTDSMGDPLWAKYMVYNSSAVEEPNGDLVIAGYLHSNIWNNGAIRIARLDSAGNLIFHKMIGPFPNNTTANSIAKTGDGGYIISGMAGISSASDAFLVKTDSSGNVSWAKFYGTNGYDLFNSAVQTSNGDFIAIGETNTPQETFMIKTDSTGTLIWSRAYQSGNSASIGYMISRTADQNFVFCGEAQNLNHASLIGKIDENGTVLWAKAYQPGSFSNGGRFYGVYETADNGFIATGFYIEVPWNGYNYIVKCDSVGGSNCFSTGISWTHSPIISKDSTVTLQNYSIGTNAITLQTECFCDSTHFICTGTIGMSDFGAAVSEVSIYPNPFSDILSVTVDVSENSEFILYDPALRRVIQQNFNKHLNINTG